MYRLKYNTTVAAPALNRPHALFAEEVLADENFARELFRLFLPREIQETIQPESLSIAPSGFSSEILRGFRSDRVYSIARREGEEPELRILLEHKSYRDAHILKQLLRYMREIHERQNASAPVIPFVLYHGTKEWNLPVSFQENMDLSPRERKALGPYGLDFQYILLNLRTLDLEKIRTTPKMRVFLFVLKHIHELDQKEVLVRLLKLMPVVYFQEKENKFIELVLFYVYSVHNYNPGTIRNLWEDLIGAGTGEIVMTTAEMLKKSGMEEGFRKGIEKGVEQGRLEARLEIARRLFHSGVSLDIVLQSTDLTRKDLENAGIFLG